MEEQSLTGGRDRSRRTSVHRSDASPPARADAGSSRARGPEDGEPTQLLGALEVTLGETPTRKAVHVVVDRCHRIACAYLRKQQRGGALREDVLGEDPEDLAIDAVAELFRRDDQGRFPELRRYFSGRGLPEMSPADAADHLRRLTLSAVTDWLFEAYRAADRSLSNQIRALKRAIRRREDIRLARKGKTLWLKPRVDLGEDPPESPDGEGRLMPLEVMEACLAGKVAEVTSTGELMEAALEALRCRNTYKVAYPVVRLAQAMRAARVRVQETTEHRSPVSRPDPSGLRAPEIEQFVDKTLTGLREEKRATYVGAGKITAEVYEAYFRALRDRLKGRFTPPRQEERTHYEALSTYLPELTQKQYRTGHRPRFEYLFRQAEEALTNRLEEDLME